MPHQFTSNRFLSRHLANYNIRTEEVTERQLTRPFQPTPVFLPGESHGQRSLVGCNPRGHKESDTTERLSARAHTHTHTHTHVKWSVLATRAGAGIQAPLSSPTINTIPSTQTPSSSLLPVSVTKRHRRLVSLLLFGTPRPISSALQMTGTNPP